jgi:hypothetical protein
MRVHVEWAKVWLLVGIVTNVEELKSIRKKEQVVQPVNNTQDKTPDFSYLHNYLFYLHKFY